MGYPCSYAVDIETRGQSGPPGLGDLAEKSVQTVSLPERSSSFLSHSFEKEESIDYVALGLSVTDVLHLSLKAETSEVNTEMGPEPAETFILKA